jgi:hypothetical protein
MQRSEIHGHQPPEAHQPRRGDTMLLISADIAAINLKSEI